MSAEKPWRSRVAPPVPVDVPVSGDDDAVPVPAKGEKKGRDVAAPKDEG